MVIRTNYGRILESGVFMFYDPIISFDKTGNAESFSILGITDIEPPSDDEPQKLNYISLFSTARGDVFTRETARFFEAMKNGSMYFDFFNVEEPTDIITILKNGRQKPGSENN